MANIPLGNFDQARVDPHAAGGAADTSPLALHGRGEAALGQGLMSAAQDVGAMAQRQKQEDDALARAKAANALAQHQLDVQGVVADVGDQLARGVDYTKAGELYQQGISKLAPPKVDGMPPSVAETYQGGLQRTQQEGRLRIGAFVTTARRDDGQKQLGTLLDTLGKQAALPGANLEAINAQARAAVPLFKSFGLDGSTLDKAVQDFQDRNYTNDAANRFNGAHDDVASLTQLQHDLTDEKGSYAGKLDPDKRNVLAARVGDRIDVLHNQAERKSDKVDALAERALTQMDQQVASGVPATMEQWAHWSDVFKNTSPDKRAEFDQRVQDERDTQAFLRLPIDQQAKGLAERQAALYTAGGDAHAIANFTRLKGAVTANIKLLQDTPLQFAQAREGTAIAPLDVTALADPSQAGKIGAQLEQRAALVGSLRKQYGPQVQNHLLLPPEQAMLSGMLGKIPPEKRVGLFGQLRTLAGSDDSYQSIMQQLAPDHPVQALAGLLQLKNPKAAALVIEGEALLDRSKADSAQDGKFKALTLPKQAEFDSALSDKVGAAFRGRPEAYALAMQAVKAGYAGASAKDGDVSGEFNEGRLDNIIGAVLGKTDDFNGHGEVFVPYGMDPSDFEDKIDAAFKARRAELPPGVPQDLGSYGLMQAGDGQYYVTSGRKFVGDAHGNPLLLEVKP